MGMPVTIEIADATVPEGAFAKAFDYFRWVDETFSTYKDHSEMMRINRGELKPEQYSAEMQEVFALCEETKKLTGGYFDIVRPDGTKDPSGLVKGWAICNAADLLEKEGYENFYVDAGGDIEARGKNARGKTWSVGIRDPFSGTDASRIVKVVYIKDKKGVATSGTYIRGTHVYDPQRKHAPIDDIVSLTVIGPNIYEADRFATATFAMGKKGIAFIEQMKGFEGYIIDKDGMATMTSGFEEYTHV